VSLIFTREFGLAALERGVKTAAQSALLVLGADQINALEAAWTTVGGFALGGFVLSVLTSVATANAVVPGPSVTTETLTDPDHPHH
jgi:hypothetical protein